MTSFQEHLFLVLVLYWCFGALLFIWQQASQSEIGVLLDEDLFSPWEGTFVFFLAMLIYAATWPAWLWRIHDE